MLKKYREYVNKTSKMLLYKLAIHRIIIRNKSVDFVLYGNKRYIIARINNTTYVKGTIEKNYTIIETDKKKSYEKAYDFDRFDGFYNKLEKLISKNGNKN